ncbi:MAG: 6-phosphogluconolactonase [Bryobacteraceae bacterium]
MSVHRFVENTAAEAAQACARQMITTLEQALAGNDQATLAVSGGRSPIPVFAALAASGLPWDRLHLFLVDERCVPPNDQQSNGRMIEEAFIAPARFPHRNFHRVHTELPPGRAADQYARDIRHVFALESGQMPVFDLIHLGMGPDGHIASLFPGDPLIDDRDHIAEAAYVEKLTQWRVTLLAGVLLQARHTVVFAPGRDKSDVTRRVFEDDFDPRALPAQIPAHLGRGVSWFSSTD